MCLMCAWEVVVPHLLVVIKYIQQVNHGGEADCAEEQHHHGVEQLDHVPVYAFVPEIEKRNFCLVNFLFFCHRAFLLVPGGGPGAASILPNLLLGIRTSVGRLPRPRRGEPLPDGLAAVVGVRGHGGFMRVVGGAGV